MNKVQIKIIGVDCATDRKKVGLAVGTFEDGETVVEDSIVCRKVDPHTKIREWLNDWEGPVLLALDAPLGWPDQMGSRLRSHRAGEQISVDANDFFRRHTDRFIREHVGKQSLDVGADRIARTAHSALKLLDRLRALLKSDIELAWSTSLRGINAIEVYPAATLKAYDIPAQRYKAKDGSKERAQICEALEKMVMVSAERQPMLDSDDELDAVICVVAGHDFLKGHCMNPVDTELASKEGWIWVRTPMGH